MSAYLVGNLLAFINRKDMNELVISARSLVLSKIITHLCTLLEHLAKYLIMVRVFSYSLIMIENTLYKLGAGLHKEKLIDYP